MDEMFEIFEVIFEIENGNQKQRSRMQAPRIMLQRQFVSLMEQAIHTNVPVRITMSRREPVWNPFEDRWIEQEYSMSFSNNAWQGSEK